MPLTDQSNGQANSARTEESSATHNSGENKTQTSKCSLRKQVWTLFEKNGLASFPRPVRGRIPNFHGAPQAAAKLGELDVFKNASYVKVNADKPQENVRILVLEKKKKLLVSAPRTKEAICMRVIPVGTSAADLKRAASRRGMLEWGKPIELGTDIKIDLVVVGSVAVTREGHRIGKGEGFGDLEFAILAESGAIVKDTVVVTTVHDTQVFQTLPHDLFREYDVPVDIIVTPTEIIQVSNKLKKPSGIIWSILSQRKMNLINIVKVLRNKKIENGKECCLKDEDTDSETERTKRRLHQARRFMKYTKKKVLGKLEADKIGASGKGGTSDKLKERKKQTRRFNKRFLKSTIDSNDNHEADIKKQKKITQRRRRFPRNSPIQFSLRIGNITSNVRVRDLKNALAARNVKPTDITWRGHKGFAFIHFAKSKKQPESPNLVDNIVASLRNMKIGNAEDGVTLLVEPTKPVTRIESTGITAV